MQHGLHVIGSDIKITLVSDEKERVLGESDGDGNINSEIDDDDDGESDGDDDGYNVQHLLNALE
jgi:hypothetical protein